MREWILLVNQTDVYDAPEYIDQTKTLSSMNHFSIGDTVSVRWGKCCTWVHCMVVDCEDNRSTFVIYPPNVLAEYFEMNHSEIYVLHDFVCTPWKWANMPADWEYEIACKHAERLSVWKNGYVFAGKDKL